METKLLNAGIYLVVVSILYLGILQYLKHVYVLYRGVFTRYQDLAYLPMLFGIGSIIYSYYLK